jgi:peroxiredoxin
MEWIRVALVIALLTIAIGCNLYTPGIKSGEPAPDFVLNDLNGNPIRLSDFLGKIVILEFWATWCPPCKIAIAELNELQAKQMDEEFVILSISIDEEVSTVKSFMEDYYIMYPVLFDDKGISYTYAAYNIPTTTVIGKDGRVLKHHIGYSPGVIEELLQEAMAEEKITEKTGS